MPFRYFFLFVFCCLLLISGCAPAYNTEKRLQVLESSMVESKVQETVLLSMEDRVDRLEEDVRALQLGKKRPRAASTTKQYRTSVPAPETSAVPADRPGGRVVVPDGGTPQQKTPSAARKSKSAPVKSLAVQDSAQTSKGKAISGKPSASSGDGAAYNNALKLYETGRFAQAQNAFEAFLQQRPNSALVPNALYWLGECFYSQGQFVKAIPIFQQVVSKYPRNAKAPASLLKTGYSYEQLKDRENARFYLEHLLQQYASSEPAPLAKAALKKL